MTNENITAIVENFGQDIPAALSSEELQAMRQWEMDQAAKRAAYAAKRGDADRSHFVKRAGDACALPRRPAESEKDHSTVKRIKNNPKYLNR